MAWTAPSTKTGASTISTSDWNTYVRDNLAAVMERPTVGLSDSRTASADYVLGSGTTYAVHWYDEDWDSHGLHSTSSNRNRITAPSGWAGIYLVVATATISGGDSDGYRRVRIRKNATTTYGESEQQPVSGRGRTTMHVAAFVDLAASDYVEIEVLQNSGSTLSLLGNLDDDELGCSCQVMYWADTTASSAALTLAGYTGADMDDWWNTEVVDSFTRLRSRPTCRFSSTNVSVSNATWTALAGTNETFDNASMHSTVTNNTRATVPLTGLYLCIAQANFTTNDDGRRDIRLMVNGVTTGTSSSSAPLVSQGLSLQVAALIYMTAGDYLVAEVYQASGAALDVASWTSAAWCGDGFAAVAGAQRADILEDWSDDPYSGGAQAGVIPQSWLDVHTRDLPGAAQFPPAIITQARFTRDITVGEWKKVKHNRQQVDSWNTVKGVRNFGEKYVIPWDGLWLFGAQVTMKDDRTISAKFTVKTTTFTVNTSNDRLTATAHGIRSGARVRVDSTTTLPGGLFNSFDYFAGRIDADTLTLHLERSGAQSGTSLVDITSAGSGTHRVSRSQVECRGLNLRTGVRVRVSTTGTLPLGLSASTDYWTIRIGPNKFRLAADEEAANDGQSVAIYDSGSGTHTVTVQEPYGARGARLVQAGEVQAGWFGQAGPDFETGRPALSILACKAGDELWCEAITTGPEGSRIVSGDPASRMFACWLGPHAYTGAEPMADRALT